MANLEAQQALDLQSIRERFELQHKQEKAAQKSRREHESSLATIQLEAQEKLSKQTESLDVARMLKLQQMEEKHQASQRQKQLALEKELSDQRLIAQEKAERLNSQGLERRLAIEAKHQAEMTEMQVKLLEQQAAVGERISKIKQIEYRGSLQSVD